MKQSHQSVKKEDPELGPHHTLIIPFSSEMNHPKRLVSLLETAGDKAEKEINERYSEEQALCLMTKLRGVLNEIKSIPNNKTLAIFISGFAKNVYFFTPTKELSIPSLRYGKPD